MTPIVFFVFNRPETTEKVLSALAAQTVKPEKLIVVADGPRNDAERAKTDTVRALIRGVNWMEVSLVERGGNLGCTATILQGITEVFQTHDRAVIIEDDTPPSARFYEAMCAMLDRYERERTVFSVGGYPSIRADALPGYPFDVILSPRFSCWGWGTWADRWRDIEPALRGAGIPFNGPDELPAGVGMDLRRWVAARREGTDTSWDTRVALHSLHRAQLHALTRHYLVVNIAGGTGTHGSSAPLTKTLELMRQHNVISDSVPARFPPVEQRDDVDASVRRYVDDILAACDADAALAEAEARRQTPLSRLCWRAIRNGMARPLYRQAKRLVGYLRPVRAVQARPPPHEYSAMVGKGSVIPAQIEAYFVALNQHAKEGDSVLDVGFGLGYGLNILAIKAHEVSGVDVDPKAYEYCQATVVGRNPRLRHLGLYDGYRLPFPDASFDLLTCVDVLEHVEDYDRLLREMLRVTRRGVFLSTPNRRPEYMNPDGSPTNYWHRREWNYEELADILRRHSPEVCWNFLNGPFEGPLTVTTVVTENTLALSPFVRKPESTVPA